MATKNAKKCCNTCNHYNKGICNILNDLLLIMINITDNNGNTVYNNNIKYSLIIKDKYINNYYCNKYISKI